MLSTESVIEEVAKLLPNDFPMDLAENIFNGMKKQCVKLAMMHADSLTSETDW